MSSDLQQLHGHPQVYITAWETENGEAQPREVCIHYRGPIEALLAARVATPEMLDLDQQNIARTDEDGDEYWVARLWYQPMDGSARYWRWQITRSKPLERALRLPGVSDAWTCYEQRRQAEEALRLEELARRPVQRLIPTDTWHHGGHGNRITRAQALDIAINHLSRRLRASLHSYESWLPESTLDEEDAQALAAGTPVSNLPRLPVGAETDSTATKNARTFSSYELRTVPLHSHAQPRTPAPPVMPIEPEPKGWPVWKISVPHDFGRTLMIGSSRVITIDASTGAVLSDRQEGE